MDKELKKILEALEDKGYRVVEFKVKEKNQKPNVIGENQNYEKITLKLIKSI